MIRFRPMVEEDWQWFKERTSVIRMEDTMGMVAYEDTRLGILAVCVADSFGPDNCNVHLAIDNPLVIRRGFLNEIANWLFVQNKRARLFGLVPSNNSKAERFNKHIGWEEIARVPNAVAEGVDYIVVEMHRDTCRWLKNVRRAA